MFSKAIARTPGKSLIHGLTTATLGVPDYHKSIQQHKSYCKALEDCGLEVTVLPAKKEFPDSTFVEDVAIMTPHCAIITNPGAPSRNKETDNIREVIGDHYSVLEEIIDPGTLEGGDVLMVGSHYFIGISDRTNLEGASQLIHILENYGMTGSVIDIEKILHLKTGVSYLENNHLLVCPALREIPEFKRFKKIVIPEVETYAANCIWVNGTVLVPAGFPGTTQKILDIGYSVIEIEMSEFQKLDGGLSCLSLRF